MKISKPLRSCLSFKFPHFEIIVQKTKIGTFVLPPKKPVKMNELFPPAFYTNNDFCC